MVSRRSSLFGSPAARALALLLPVCVTTACGDAVSPGPGQKTGPGTATSSPTGDAYAALVRGDYAALPGIIDVLDEAVASDPEDPSSAFFAGVMRLWRITQRDDDPSYSSFSADTQAAFSNLDTARKLDPKDPHAAGFYGIARIDAGNLVGDQATIDDGGGVLEAAVPLYPAYIHGIQALAYGALPKGHADFPKAGDALISTVEACVPGATAAEPMDVAYPKDVPAARRGACSDDGVVAHVWEGFWLTYGDIASKQGDAQKARVAYENVKHAPRYDRWTLTDVLEQRLADLETRTGLYVDDDPMNDPMTWMQEGHMCVGCHANKQ